MADTSHLSDALNWIVNPPGAIDHLGIAPAWVLAASLVLAAAAGLGFALATRKWVGAEPAIRWGESDGDGRRYASVALILLGAYLLSGAIALQFIGGSAEQLKDPPQMHRFLVLRSSFLICATLACVFMASTWRLGPRGTKAFALTRLLWLYGPWLALSITLAWLAFSLLLVAGSPIHTQEVLEQLMVESEWRLAAAILSAVVAAPLFEEMFFRFAFQGYLRRHMPFMAAAGISVACFVALHFRWNEAMTAQPWHLMLPMFGMGLALAWVYERSGSIWYSIGLHALHNFLTVMLVMA